MAECGKRKLFTKVCSSGNTQPVHLLEIYRELHRATRGLGLAPSRLMTNRGPRLLLVWLLVLAGCSSPAGPSSVEAGTPASSSAASALALLTNAERRQAGLPALAMSQSLMRAAQLHADQMASMGQMAHSLPGARYPEPQDRLAAVGYRWQAYAENVAYGQGSPASAMSSWMGSSGHRANILNPGLTEIGAAVANGSDGRPYWVQVFGNPR